MKPEPELKQELFDESLRAVQTRTSELFTWLLLAQWALAVVLALLVSPQSWSGRASSLHLHVKLAAIGGGVINLLPLILLRLRPGWWVTRHLVAVVQVLWSAILIHVTGGRIETHFHIFGSLAFLAFYRDWKVLLTATAVVAADHLARGLFWPESVYGISNPEWWRFLEHAAWVAFEDVVLILGCLRAIAEMRLIADREAALAQVNSEIERSVKIRTAELSAANLSLAAEMKVRLQMESELRQSQKLESVGRLAAGVAHEINTPVQYVSDSIHFLRDATGDLLGVIEKLRRVERSVLEGAPSRQAASEALEAEEAADLPYLTEQLPQAFARSLDGLSRVATIVRSMKQFAHPDQKEMGFADLNQAIQSTLVIARNEYKYVADLETDFAELPPVLCHVGDLNQAVLNIVVNAAHAVGEVVVAGARGRITVRTRREGEVVVIAVSDSGAGIPLAIRERIFDPFFTTKEVGKGTGQGLAIARSVVVERHQGSLTLETEVGQGTTFFIRLPIGGVAASSGGERALLKSA